MSEGSVNLGSAYAELKLKKEGFDSGLKSAENDLTAFQKSTQDKLNVVSEGFIGLGNSMSKFGGQLTATVTTPILGVATAAVKTTATFDQSMSKVQALSGATGEEFDTLRAKALEMGSTTAFTASEAADALSYMGLAGWDTEQMISGLPGVLDLAASSQMDLATASDMVTDYLTAFGLEAKDATTMANQMAYAQANSNTSTMQLGDAFGNCAAQMHTAGQTMETTTAFLEAMANQGLKGSEAGTALAAVMRDITQKMEDGKIAIGDTSVEVMDQEGNFRNLIDIMADVEKATDGLGTAEKSAALMETFTARSIKAVSMSLTEGTDNLYDYENALYSVDGVAGDMAETMLGNLSGQITILKSNIEGLLIQIGDILLPYVSQAVSKIQEIIKYFTELDEEQKKQILKWAAIAASIGPALLVMGKLLTSVGGLIKTFSSLSGFIVKFAKVFGLLSSGSGGLVAALGSITAAAGPILAIVGAVVALGVALKALYDQGGAFKESVDNLVATLKDSLGSVLEHVKGVIEDLKEGFTKFFDVIKGFVSKMDFSAIDKAMAGITDAVGDLVKALTPIINFVIDFLGKTLRVLLDAVAPYVAAVINGILNALEPFLRTVRSIIDIVTDVINNVRTLIEGFVTGDFTAFKESMAKFFDDILGFYKNLLDTIIAFFAGFIEGFVESAHVFFDTMVQNVVNFIKDLWAKILEFLSNLPYKIGYWLGELIVLIPKKLKQIKDDIAEWGKNLKKKATEIAKAFFDNMKEWFSQLPDKIWEFIKSIPEKIWGAKDDMYNAGSGIFTALWDGMKAIWDSITGWFTDVWNSVKNFVKGIKDGMAEADSASEAAGSHADGLAYVPYNGYVAQLHEGERVLTRNEAQAYNSSANTGYTFNYYSPKAIDPYEANKLFKKSVREVEGGFA